MNRQQTDIPSLYTSSIFLSVIFGNILKRFCHISGYTERVLFGGKLLLPFYLTLNEMDSAPQHATLAYPSTGTGFCLSVCLFYTS